MATVRIIYDVEGWAYHNEALALQKYAARDFEVSLAACPHADDAGAALGETAVDLVFLLAERKTHAVRAALQQRGWQSKLVVGWSSGFPHRLGLFYGVRADADAWIFNNRDAWEWTGRLPHTYMIANGVDLQIFNVQQPREMRAPTVLWTGSQQYRGLKGYDEIMLPLQARLGAVGIACDLWLVDSRGSERRTPQQMAEWYNRGTVLVCASATEGTPNPALEAAACGCTVVSTPVGNMPELIRHDVNGYLVERDLEVLTAAVTRACDNYLRLSAQMQQDIQPWHWTIRAAEFYDVFRRVLEGGDPPPPRRSDLSSIVTVFVTTVGAPTAEACLEHLRAQDCSYALQVIDRVAPMNVAFQRMLDDCRTPYYVQVDEDMLLYPHAVRTLYETIAGAAPDVAMYVASLYDVHLQRSIQGVKIFRHDIVRRYPLEAVDAFESRQVMRLEADGYVVLPVPTGTKPVAGQTLGLHGTMWTSPSIYERYLHLERRRRAYPERTAWFAAYPAAFLRRFLEDPSEQNFFALMGTVAGALTSNGAELAAKDCRRPESPGFRALQQFFDEVTRGAADIAPRDER